MELSTIAVTIVEQAPNFIFAGVGLYLMHRISIRQADVIDKVVDSLLEMAERNTALVERNGHSQNLKN